MHDLKMFKIFCYILCSILVILAVFSCSLDVHLLIYSIETKFSSVGEFWFRLSPNSLQISEAIVSRYIDPCSLFRKLNCSPFLWHPIISTILTLPATLFFLVTSLLIFSISKLIKKKRSLYFYR